MQNKYREKRGFPVKTWWFFGTNQDFDTSLIKSSYFPHFYVEFINYLYLNLTLVGKFRIL